MSGGLCEPSRGLVCGREWELGGRVIELVLDAPRNSTLSGCQPHVVTERCGVKGVAREGRALARPRHRAGARRSQDASHSAFMGGMEAREGAGGDEHGLVGIAQPVIDRSWQPSNICGSHVGAM